MVVRDWTHPHHRYPALLGVLFNMLATMFVVLGVTRCMFHPRDSEVCFSVLDNGIFCSENFCHVSRENLVEDRAGWQGIVSILLLAALSINGVSMVVQIFVFWPLAMTKGVFNIILRVCAFFEIISGFIKLSAGFMILSVQVTMNKPFMRFHAHAVEMRILPAGLIQFSVIFSFLCALLLILASDIGARGYPSYLVIIEEEEKENKRMEELVKRVSVYRPSSKPIIEYKKKSMGSSTSV